MKLPCTHIKNSHIAIGRFTEATRLRRYRYAVAEQTDYSPYGMPMADVNSASAQPFKFGGKELEREGGMDFYLPLRLLRRRPRQLHRPNGRRCCRIIGRRIHRTFGNANSKRKRKMAILFH